MKMRLLLTNPCRFAIGFIVPAIAHRAIRPER